MTTALGQFIRRRPRVAAWVVAGACVFAGSSVRAQNSPNDLSRSDGETGRGTRVARPAFVGTITGRVTDARTAAPITAALVEVEGTRLATTTGADGRYRLVDVPAGSRVISVRRLGYTASRQTVTVTDNQQATADFALAAAAVSLDQVVVTGTAGGEQRRSIGNSVATINASEELERSAAPNLGNLLQSRAAGVIVTPSTGRVGAGPTIQIRGRSSLSLSSEPIVYVDGVRVNNATGQGPSGANASSFGAQNSQVASRLNDINPEDIETIEIIKGPAAATIYGTEAANGVIQIITKRGRSGQAPQWGLTLRQGTQWFQDPEGRIPTNYGRDASSNIVTWNAVTQENARGTPIWNNGHLQTYTASLSGGLPVVRYSLSGTYDDDNGIEPNNKVNRFTGHANLTIAPSEKVDVSSSVNIVRGKTHLGADYGLSSFW